MSVASGISSNNGGQERDRVVSSNSLALGSVILCIFQGERERRGEGRGKKIQGTVYFQMPITNALKSLETTFLVSRVHTNCQYV